MTRRTVTSATAGAAESAHGRRRLGIVPLAAHRHPRADPYRSRSTIWPTAPASPPPTNPGHGKGCIVRRRIPRAFLMTPWRRPRLTTGAPAPTMSMRPRGEFGRGMKPEPPDLAHTGREMELREVYWVLPHGIRHTGMPAFGGSHSKEDLWAIATFVERFDEITPARYEQWIKESGAESGSHSH